MHEATWLCKNKTLSPMLLACLFKETIELIVSSSKGKVKMLDILEDSCLLFWFFYPTWFDLWAELQVHQDGRWTWMIRNPAWNNAWSFVKSSFQLSVCVFQNNLALPLTGGKSKIIKQRTVTCMFMFLSIWQHIGSPAKILFQHLSGNCFIS